MVPKLKVPMSLWIQLNGPVLIKLTLLSNDNSHKNEKQNDRNSHYLSDPPILMAKWN